MPRREVTISTDGVDKPESFTPSITTLRIVRLLCRRDEVGKAKYEGKTLDRADLNMGDWLRHSVEESLDNAGYLLRAADEFEELVAGEAGCPHTAALDKAEHAAKVEAVRLERVTGERDAAVAELAALKERVSAFAGDL